MLLDKCELVTAFSCFKSHEYEPITYYNHFHLNECQTKKKTFRLKTNEIKIFYSCLDRMGRMNNRLIKHIFNFESRKNNDDFNITSITSLEKFLEIISETRRNLEDSLVCEYEYIKFCELYYLTLHYIMKYEENLLIDFFQFSKNSILPILKELQWDINSNKIFRIPDLIVENCNYIKKMSDEGRRDSLVTFLIQFLRNNNQILSLDRIDENYTVDDLISLCFNVFTAIYMRNRRVHDEFFKNFKRQQYNISFIFSDYLFTNGRLKGLSYDGRVQLKRFLNENYLDLETQFIQQNLIPPSSDKIIERVLSLELIRINDNNV